MWREVLFAIVGIVAFCALIWFNLSRLNRPFWKLVLWPHYRIIARGVENIPKAGATVLAGNHVSWLDGFILTAASPRTGWNMVASAYVRGKFMDALAKRLRVIPVAAKGPHAQKAAITASRAVIDRDEMLGLFPEAQLSRNGLPAPFLRGIEVILKGHETVQVVPFAIEGMWGSFFTHSGGHYFGKWPKMWRRTVVVSFGPPLPRPVTAFSVRQAYKIQSVDAYKILGKPHTAETINSELPSLPGLTVSTADFDNGYVKQVGWKPDSVGQAEPGVALRVVDQNGIEQGPDVEGNLQVLTVSSETWKDTGYLAKIDRDGFVFLVARPLGV